MLPSHFFQDDPSCPSTQLTTEHLGLRFLRNERQSELATEIGTSTFYPEPSNHQLPETAGNSSILSLVCKLEAMGHS